jgi:hypothetical protein
MTLFSLTLQDDLDGDEEGEVPDDDDPEVTGAEEEDTEAVNAANNPSSISPGSNSPSDMIMTGGLSKCIYIDSVDSGRSSDTGTHQSWTSSSSSTKSSTKSHEVNDVPEISSNHAGGSVVQIVPHTFCDYLGTIKKQQQQHHDSLPTSTVSSDGYASMTHSCQRRRRLMNKLVIEKADSSNKVRVYVPYSTLIALTSEIRETPVDDLDESDADLEEEDNVVICDTQVILRINPDKESHKVVSGTKNNINNKRMTRRLLMNPGPYHCDKDLDMTTQATSSKKPQQCPKIIPRRKDLCRLLGLNEQDVDLMIVPEVRVAAQKVALSHNQQKLGDDPSSNSWSGGPGDMKSTAKKKDLAKFLGVEQTQTTISPAETALQESTATGGGSIKSITKGPSKSSVLTNWGQMVKSSVKGWIPADSESSSDCEMDVPVQLRQISSREPDRTNRKDLSKFLGFDDSDSEEIVFIRNSAAPDKASLNNSSLTRSSILQDIHAHNGQDSDDSVGSLRSFDSFVRRSLRCGASSEFANIAKIAQEPGENVPKRGATIRQQQQQQQQQQNHVGELNHNNNKSKQNHVVKRKRKKDAEKRAQEVLTKQTLTKSEISDQQSHKLATLDYRAPSRKPPVQKSVAFGANSRRLISPVRNHNNNKRHSDHQMPPIFRREEPLYLNVYPQKPALFYQHYPTPMYPGHPVGFLPPVAVNPNNGRIRVSRQLKRPQMTSGSSVAENQ